MAIMGRIIEMTSWSSNRTQSRGINLGREPDPSAKIKAK